jgi:hypothetical protein
MNQDDCPKSTHDILPRFAVHVHHLAARRDTGHIPMEEQALDERGLDTDEIRPELRVHAHAALEQRLHSLDAARIRAELVRRREHIQRELPRVPLQRLARPISAAPCARGTRGTHRAQRLPASARAPSSRALRVYATQSATSALNLLSARSNIANCRRTSA